MSVVKTLEAKYVVGSKWNATESPSILKIVFCKKGRPPSELGSFRVAVGRYVGDIIKNEIGYVPYFQVRLYWSAS
jgi:hypothetical protein